MTDKVQKIEDWISKTQDSLMDANGNFEYPEHEGAYHILCSLDYYIHSLQEEPISEDLEEAAKRYALNNTPWDDCADEMQDAFKAGAKWQKTKDESATKDLGEYINELSKQFPEVSFAKLSRIAVRVAKWQKEHFEKERLKHCDALTAEQAQIESDFVVNHLKKNNRTPTFIDAIEYGMRLQKE